jgi:hypothetical protein
VRREKRALWAIAPIRRTCSSLRAEEGVIRHRGKGCDPSNQIMISVFDVKDRSLTTVGEGSWRSLAGRARFLLEAPVQTSGLVQVATRSGKCEAPGGYPARFSEHDTRPNGSMYGLQGKVLLEGPVPTSGLAPLGRRSGD